MSYHIYKDLFNATASGSATASGLMKNWVNPFTSASGAIVGLSVFDDGDAESAWHEDFLKNLYLIDYYTTYIIDTSGETNRALSGSPIMVGDSALSRLDYLWDIVKQEESTLGITSGDIETAIEEWGNQLDGSGTIDGNSFNSYTTIGIPSGELPKLKSYAWSPMTYWDNYDGDPVFVNGYATGGSINATTGQSGVSIDLSRDDTIDDLSAPTTASGYLTTVTGANAYLSAADVFSTYYTEAYNASTNLIIAPVWSDDDYDGSLADASGTIVNPTNPLWATDNELKTMTVETTHLASGDLNIISRDVAQKTMVYLSRSLNYLHRLTYGSIGGFETDIPTASGSLAFDFTIQNGSNITPSGGAAWPVQDNPFASGELSPVDNSLMYNPDTPDFHWRKRINEMDTNLGRPSDYGSMPWLLSKLRYMRYRMYQLVGDNSRQKGGRLWRSIMPEYGTYATKSDLPEKNGEFFSTTVTRDESDGVFYVKDENTWYYWNKNTSDWEIAWSNGTQSGEFPNVPNPYGIVTGQGVTGLSSFNEIFDVATYRNYYAGPPASGDWHVAPGVDIYSQIVKEVHNKDVGNKIVDQGVVDDYGINLESFVGGNNQGYMDTNPSTQFISQFQSLHDKIGSAEVAELMSGKTMSDIQKNDFLEDVFFTASGEFDSGEFIRQLIPIISWHIQSVGELETGNLDIGNYPGKTLSYALTNGFYNLMEYMEFVSGDGSLSGNEHPTPSGISARYIGPHRITYIDDNDPGFYGGVKLTYFDEDA